MNSCGRYLDARTYTEKEETASPDLWGRSSMPYGRALLREVMKSAGWMTLPWRYALMG